MIPALCHLDIPQDIPAFSSPRPDTGLSSFERFFPIPPESTLAIRME